MASANVYGELSRDDAGRCLDALLDREPDLVGLQEWRLPRLRLLRRSGPVHLVPGPRLPLSGLRGAAEYLWSAPVLGGCVVGARAARFEHVRSRWHFLSAPGRADRDEGSWGIEPSRIATVGVFRDRLEDRSVSLISFHLVHGVQARGRYRDDRPVLAGRHRAEAQRLQRLVDEERGLGRTVYAVGDSNFDGFRLTGLTSAWEGREHEPGTLGRRKVDDVHGPGPALEVTLLTSDSDHKAVVTARADS